MKGMIRFWMVVAILALTAAILGLTSPMEGGVSVTHLFGVPLVVVGDSSDSFAILTIGAGPGVMVLGAGAGLIVLGVAGLGVLFGMGQLAAGGIAFGQVGLGAVFFCGQAGTGLAGLGQAALSLEKYTQEDKSGRRFFELLNEDLGEYLSFRSSEKDDS